MELKAEEGREGKSFLLIYRREMNAEKLEDWELEMWDEKLCSDLSQSNDVCSNAKRALIGAGARALFYPTLLYNVVRNKIQPEFHWWDRVDEVNLCKFFFSILELSGFVPFFFPVSVVILRMDEADLQRKMKLTA